MSHRRTILLAAFLGLTGCSRLPRLEANDAGDTATAEARAAQRADPSGASLRLRFDGVYRGPRHYAQGAWIRTYLRFYPDGRVIVVPSARGLDDIDDWFTRENPTVAAADAAFGDARVSFVLHPEDEAIVYAGTVTDDGLILETRKPHTGLRRSQLFRFAPRRPEAAIAGLVPPPRRR